MVVGVPTLKLHVIAVHLVDFFGVDVIDEFGVVDEAFVLQGQRFFGAVLFDQEPVVLVCLVQRFLNGPYSFSVLDFDEFLDQVFPLLGGIQVVLRFSPAPLAVILRFEQNIGGLFHLSQDGPGSASSLQRVDTAGVLGGVGLEA